MATDNDEAERGLKLKRLANMISGFSNRWGIPALGILMSVIWLAPIQHGKAAETGEEIFQSYCAACHTIGKGKLVGPDLAGVTSRRDESWLQRQIKEPDALIAENDPIVMQLLQEAGNVEMPPLELSDEEVTAVIAYLKSTEQQTNVATSLPSQYWPTLLISLLVLICLTLIGLRTGKKKVDVR
ncbi:MAG: cytochrome c [Candidatus Hydrogenedentes bacterium]|nr:cytochrome c [Candidatus Hydrogenedentota bacterium]